MASSSSQRFAFPLPERALPRIQISPEQHEELRAFAVRSAHDVLRDGPTWGRSNVQAARERGWKVSQRTPDVCFMMKTTTNDKPSASGSTGSNMGSSRGFRAAPSSAGSPSESSSSSPPVAEDGTPGRRITSGGAGGRAFMGSVRLAGYNLDDVVASLYCETTAATRDQLVKSYGHAYLDCCVLQTLEGAKPHDPFWYLGLKWTALKTPFEKLVNYREFVYLEHSGTHVNAQGQRMLYRILQSVKLEEFGGEPAYFGLTRAHLEAAYVYWMDAPSGHVLSDNGVLTVSMRGLAHPKGKVPLWLVERYMKKFWKAGWALQGSDGAAVSKLALDDQLALDLATEWVADADRKACALCQKKFRFGRRMRHHCRACGEVICRNCTQYFLLTYPTSTATTTTTATGGSVAGTFPYQNFSEGGETQSQRKRAQNGFRGFLDQDDDDDMPATLGDNRTLSQSRLRLGRGMSGAAGGSTRGGDRGRQRGASDNDAVMVGKVCRRCVEMKKIAIRRDTSTCGSNPSFIKKQRRGLPRSQSWEPNSIHNTGGGGHHLLKPQPIHEHQDEDREEHEALPIMGHDDESDTEYFAPETPGPIINHGFYHNYNQQPGHDQDDTASEFSVGDFEASQAFKSYANAQTTAAGGYPSLAIGTSLGSRFSQSGFSVGINVHEDESDDDDQGGEVDYHSDPEQQPAAPAQAARIHHPQLGQLTQLTVEEEERFTSSQPRVQQPMLPPPPVAQNFVLNAAALHAQRYKEDARLRIEDLLADTDDEGEGEGDYSTSPPMRPSALDISIHEMRPQPHLIRTASAPATTANNNNNQYQRERFAPPPPPPQPMAPSTHHASIEDDVTALPQLGKVHISANRDQNRESNLSTLSFSSFDADMLIDAAAFDEDDDDHIRRMSTTIDGDEADEDDVLFARIQKIQDEVLRRQLLASSDASSLASSYGPTPIRLNRNGRVASNANNGTSLSDGSTISSTDSFGSTAPLEFVRQSSAPQIAGHKAHKVAQLQVASAIEEQAQLLYRIQMERDRVASVAEARGNGVRLY